MTTAAPPSPPRSQRAHRAGRRGFTLLELLLGVTGGMFVSIAVFIVAKQTTDTYREEARLNTTTSAAVIGFDRLQGDIARAGFMMSPNLSVDPHYCKSGVPPASITALTSLRWSDMSTVGGVPAVLSGNGNNRSPDVLLLAGAYTTTEQFPVTAVTANTVQLDTFSTAIARTGYRVTGADQTAILQALFPAGHGLRLVDTEGGQHYGVIASVNQTGLISLTGSDIVLRSTSTGGCGVRGIGAGALVNPVSLIRYRLADAATTAALFPMLGATGIAGVNDPTQTNLIREYVSLAALNTVIPGSAELVAEYAVDLKFGLTVDNRTATGADPSLLQIAINDSANLTTWAGGSGTNTQGPHRIRAVRARLGVRTRQADELSPLPSDLTATAATPLFRLGVGGAGTNARYARVRNMEANIALRNQLEAQW